jgi:hypothetical protein
MHPRGGVAALLAVSFALTGCRSLAPDPAAAAAAAIAFRGAVRRSDGVSACRLLSPDVRSAVAQSAGKRCSAAIVGSGISGYGRPVHVDAYGQNARVVFADDVLFLADFPPGWRVTAAGCTPRVDRPYDCSVEGN